VAPERCCHQRGASSPTPHEKLPESVLVLDDEAVIRSLAGTMLGFLGYAATTSATGEEAIEHYECARASGAPYFTVIMDLTIHVGMGGKDAAQQILLLDPAARLIVSSWYSDDPVVANHAWYGFRSMLPKPYRLAEMTNVLAGM